MKSLLLLLFWFAGSAFADEATPVPSQPREYPVSSLYISPADASRFNAPVLGTLLEQTRSLSRTDFVSGKKNDDAVSRTATVRFIRKATPSVYFGFSVVHYDEQDQANNTLITGDRKLSTRRLRTEAGPEVAYKLMDKIVVGLGLKYRHVETHPGTGKPLDLTHPVFENGVLLRSEWYEAEISQRLFSYDQAVAAGKERQFRRELTAAVRYHSSSTWTTGIRYTRNPVPLCCLVPASTRPIYALSNEIQNGALKHEILLSYAPSYHAYDVNEVRHQGLSYSGFYALSPALTLQASIAGESGAEKSSQVQVATASGVETEADVEAFAWSFGFGATVGL